MFTKKKTKFFIKGSGPLNKGIRSQFLSKQQKFGFRKNSQPFCFALPITAYVKQKLHRPSTHRTDCLKKEPGKSWTQIPFRKPFLVYSKFSLGLLKNFSYFCPCKSKGQKSMGLNVSASDSTKGIATLNSSKNDFYNRPFDKGRLKALVSWSISYFGEKKTIDLVEQLKSIGYAYATKAGISLSIDDLKIPPSKKDYIRKAEQVLDFTNQEVKKGHLTSIEYFSKVIETWNKTSEGLKEEVILNFKQTDELNPVFIMAFSGARGNISQVRQLTSMRGLMSDPQGRIINFPIQSNFREGLTLTEYLISCYGARKGVVDTALRTATSGYLTRRLVDVAHHVIVRGFNCGTKRGIFLTDLKKGERILLSLKTRIVGRRLGEDIYNSKNELIATKNQEISNNLSNLITKTKTSVFVRSPLTCEAKNYVCQLCYGWSLANHRLVASGEAVGIIAAQSIGEPGTQLTMRTFHTGGVFSGEVSEEIKAPFQGIITFSNRIPGQLIRTTYGLMAFLTKQESILYVTLKDPEPKFNEKETEAIKDPICSKSKVKFQIPAYTLLFVKQNQFVEKNQVLAEVSSFLAGQNQSIESYQTIYSEFPGEVLFQRSKGVYALKTELERLVETKDLSPNLKSKLRRLKTIFNPIVNSSTGEFWILSAQKQMVFKPVNLFVKPGDFIHQNGNIYFFKHFAYNNPFLKSVAFDIRQPTVKESALKFYLTNKNSSKLHSNNFSLNRKSVWKKSEKLKIFSPPRFSDPFFCKGKSKKSLSILGRGTDRFFLKTLKQKYLNSFNKKLYLQTENPSPSLLSYLFTKKQGRVKTLLKNENCFFYDFGEDSLVKILNETKSFHLNFFNEQRYFRKGKLFLIQTYPVKNFIFNLNKNSTKSNRKTKMNCQPLANLYFAPKEQKELLLSKKATGKENEQKSFLNSSWVFTKILKYPFFKTNLKMLSTCFSKQSQGKIDRTQNDISNELNLTKKAMATKQIGFFPLFKTATGGIGIQEFSYTTFESKLKTAPLFLLSQFTSDTILIPLKKKEIQNFRFQNLNYYYFDPFSCFVSDKNLTQIENLLQIQHAFLKQNLKNNKNPIDLNNISPLLFLILNGSSKWQTPPKLNKIINPFQLMIDNSFETHFVKTLLEKNHLLNLYYFLNHPFISNQEVILDEKGSIFNLFSKKNYHGNSIFFGRLIPKKFEFQKILKSKDKKYFSDIFTNETFLNQKMEVLNRQIKTVTPLPFAIELKIKTITDAKKLKSKVFFVLKKNQTDVNSFLNQQPKSNLKNGKILDRQIKVESLKNGAIPFDPKVLNRKRRQALYNSLKKTKHSFQSNVYVHTKLCDQSGEKRDKIFVTNLFNVFKKLKTKTSVKNVNYGEALFQNKPEKELFNTVTKFSENSGFLNSKNIRKIPGKMSSDFTKLQSKNNRPFLFPPLSPFKEKHMGQKLNENFFLKAACLFQKSKGKAKQEFSLSPFFENFINRHNSFFWFSREQKILNLTNLKLQKTLLTEFSSFSQKDLTIFDAYLPSIKLPHDKKRTLVGKATFPFQRKAYGAKVETNFFKLPFLTGKGVPNQPLKRPLLIEAKKYSSTFFSNVFFFIQNYAPKFNKTRQEKLMVTSFQKVPNLFWQDFMQNNFNYGVQKGLEKYFLELKLLPSKPIQKKGFGLIRKSELLWSLIDYQILRNYKKIPSNLLLNGNSSNLLNYSPLLNSLLKRALFFNLAYVKKKKFFEQLGLKTSKLKKTFHSCSVSLFREAAFESRKPLIFGIKGEKKYSNSFILFQKKQIGFLIRELNKFHNVLSPIKMVSLDLSFSTSFSDPCFSKDKSKKRDKKSFDLKEPSLAFWNPNLVEPSKNPFGGVKSLLSQSLKTGQNFFLLSPRFYQLNPILPCYLNYQAKRDDKLENIAFKRITNPMKQNFICNDWKLGSSCHNGYKEDRFGDACNNSKHDKNQTQAFNELSHLNLSKNFLSSLVNTNQTPGIVSSLSLILPDKLNYYQSLTICPFNKQIRNRIYKNIKNIHTKPLCLSIPLVFKKNLCKNEIFLSKVNFDLEKIKNYDSVVRKKKKALIENKISNSRLKSKAKRQKVNKTAFAYFANTKPKNYLDYFSILKDHENTEIPKWKENILKSNKQDYLFAESIYKKKKFHFLFSSVLLQISSLKALFYHLGWFETAFNATNFNKLEIDSKNKNYLKNFTNNFYLDNKVDWQKKLTFLSFLKIRKINSFSYINFQKRNFNKTQLFLPLPLQKQGSEKHRSEEKFDFLLPNNQVEEIRVSKTKYPKRALKKPRSLSNSPLPNRSAVSFRFDFPIPFGSPLKRIKNSPPLAMLAPLVSKSSAKSKMGPKVDEIFLKNKLFLLLPLQKQGSEKHVGKQNFLLSPFNLDQNLSGKIPFGFLFSFQMAQKEKKVCFSTFAIQKSGLKIPNKILDIYKKKPELILLRASENKEQKPFLLKNEPGWVFTLFNPKEHFKKHNFVNLAGNFTVDDIIFDNYVTLTKFLPIRFETHLFKLQPNFDFWLTTVKSFDLQLLKKSSFFETTLSLCFSDPCFCKGKSKKSFLALLQKQAWISNYFAFLLIQKTKKHYLFNTSTLRFFENGFAVLKFIRTLKKEKPKLFFLLPLQKQGSEKHRENGILTFLFLRKTPPALIGHSIVKQASQKNKFLNNFSSEIRQREKIKKFEIGFHQIKMKLFCFNKGLLKQKSLLKIKERKKLFLIHPSIIWKYRFESFLKPLLIFQTDLKKKDSISFFEKKQLVSSLNKSFFLFKKVLTIKTYLKFYFNTLNLFCGKIDLNSSDKTSPTLKMKGTRKYSTLNSIRKLNKKFYFHFNRFKEIQNSVNQIGIFNKNTSKHLKNRNEIKVFFDEFYDIRSNSRLKKTCFEIKKENKYVINSYCRFCNFKILKLPRFANETLNKYFVFKAFSNGFNSFFQFKAENEKFQRLPLLKDTAFHFNKNTRFKPKLLILSKSLSEKALPNGFVQQTSSVLNSTFFPSLEGDIRMNNDLGPQAKCKTKEEITFNFSGPFVFSNSENLTNFSYFCKGKSKGQKSIGPNKLSNFNKNKLFLLLPLQKKQGSEKHGEKLMFYDRKTFQFISSSTQVLFFAQKATRYLIENSENYKKMTYSFIDKANLLKTRFFQSLNQVSSFNQIIRNQKQNSLRNQIIFCKNSYYNKFLNLAINNDDLRFYSLKRNHINSGVPVSYPPFFQKKKSVSPFLELQLQPALKINWTFFNSNVSKQEHEQKFLISNSHESFNNQHFNETGILDSIETMSRFSKNPGSSLNIDNTLPNFSIWPEKKLKIKSSTLRSTFFKNDPTKKNYFRALNFSAIKKSFFITEKFENRLFYLIKKPFLISSVDSFSPCFEDKQSRKISNLFVSNNNIFVQKGAKKTSFNFSDPKSIGHRSYDSRVFFLNNSPRDSMPKDHFSKQFKIFNHNKSIRLLQLHFDIEVSLNQNPFLFVYNLKPLKSEFFQKGFKTTSKFLRKNLNDLNSKPNRVLQRQILPPLGILKQSNPSYGEDNPETTRELKQAGLSSLKGEVFFARNSRPFKLVDVLLSKKSYPEIQILTDSDLATFRITNKDSLKLNGFEKQINRRNDKFKMYVGQLVRYGKEITPGIGLNQSGQIIFLQANKMVLRYAKPFFLSSGGVCDLVQGDFVENQSPLLTLKYKSLKTEDIVQGIPKIEQLFEARENFQDELGINNLLRNKFLFYKTLFPQKEAVRKSFEFIQHYIIDGIQNVYQSQGVNISDKHIEIIVKQMTSKVRILEPRNSGLLRGDIVDLDWIEIMNSYLPSGKKAKYEPIVLGITKASLDRKGFISAASFQETIKVLTKATILQRRDYLRGLKENVILGHLINSGTGSTVHSNLNENKINFLSRFLPLKDLHIKLNLPNSSFSK